MVFLSRKILIIIRILKKSERNVLVESKIQLSFLIMNKIFIIDNCIKTRKENYGLHLKINFLFKMIFKQININKLNK